MEGAVCHREHAHRSNPRVKSQQVLDVVWFKTCSTIRHTNMFGCKDDTGLKTGGRIGDLCTESETAAAIRLQEELETKKSSVKDTSRVG